MQSIDFFSMKCLSRGWRCRGAVHGRAKNRDMAGRGRGDEREINSHLLH